MRREELLANDDKLFAYKWIFVAFVVTPPLLVFWKEPLHNFFPSLRDFLLQGLLLPLLVLVGLYVLRRRSLVGLMERGREVEGTVVRVKGSSGKMLGYWSSRRVNMQRVEVAFRLDGEAKTTDIDVHLGVLEPDAHVTLLVDPLNVRRALLLEAH